MGRGRRHGGEGGFLKPVDWKVKKSMEYLNLLQLYGLEISLDGTCVLSYRKTYI